MTVIAAFQDLDGNWTALDGAGQSLINDLAFKITSRHPVQTVQTPSRPLTCTVQSRPASVQVSTPSPSSRPAPLIRGWADGGWPDGEMNKINKTPTRSRTR